MEVTCFRKGRFDYYRKLSFDNKFHFHLIAILYRGKSVVKVGTNSSKTHPKYGRFYQSGHFGHSLHAETSVLHVAKPGDELVVIRWKKNGEPTMSLPCPSCQQYLKEAGIKTVYYTDWDGEFQKLKL